MFIAFDFRARLHACLLKNSEIKSTRLYISRRFFLEGVLKKHIASIESG
jgi:hypothetical protein